MPIQIALDSLKQAASGTANSATFLRGDNAFSSTFSSPVISGTATGTYTLGGTPSLAATALTGTIAAARLPAGSVLQVVQAVTNSNITTTSASPQQSGLTITIIPTSSTSKFLLMLNGGNTFNSALSEIWYYWGRNIGGAGFTVLNSNQQYGLFANQYAVNKYSASICYLDSPSTSSSIVYQPYFSTNGGGGTAYFNQSSVAMTFTVMEIAA